MKKFNRVHKEFVREIVYALLWFGDKDIVTLVEIKKRNIFQSTKQCLREVELNVDEVVSSICDSVAYYD